MPCSRGTTFGQPDGSAFPVSCESLSAAPSQRKDRYRDACVSEPATPDSDVPPLCEAPPAFDKEREDAQGYNSTLPSPETSKTLQNKAKAEFSFWMKSMDRSELQQNKLAEVIRTARYHPPPSWRRSATPSSISSTVSFSPPRELPPRREQRSTQPQLDVCQICESGAIWRETERCDGCGRYRGSCCASKPPAPFNAYCVECEIDSGNSQEDAEGILALTRACKAARCATLTNILLHLAQKKHTV